MSLQMTRMAVPALGLLAAGCVSAQVQERIEPSSEHKQDAERLLQYLMDDHDLGNLLDTVFGTRFSPDIEDPVATFIEILEKYEKQLDDDVGFLVPAAALAGELELDKPEEKTSQAMHLMSRWSYILDAIQSSAIDRLRVPKHPFGKTFKLDDEIPEEYPKYRALQQIAKIARARIGTWRAKMKVIADAENARQGKKVYSGRLKRYTADGRPFPDLSGVRFGRPSGAKVASATLANPTSSSAVDTPADPTKTGPASGSINNPRIPPSGAPGMRLDDKPPTPDGPLRIGVPSNLYYQSGVAEGPSRREALSQLARFDRPQDSKTRSRRFQGNRMARNAQARVSRANNFAGKAHSNARKSGRA